MIVGVLVPFITLLLFADEGSGHALYMLQSPYCDSYALSTSQSIMGSKMKQDTSGRTIIAKRNNAPLASGSTYVGGETLTVTVSTFQVSINFEVVFQAQGL